MSELSSELYEAFMAAARDTKASGRDVEAALITLLAVHMGHNLKTEAQQDAYLNWFVSGVETLLKKSGVRSTARPNPLAAEKPSGIIRPQ